MSEIIAIAYENESQAEKVKIALNKLKKQKLIQLEDCLVVIKNKDGKLDLKQSHNLANIGAITGGYLGAVVGTLFLLPLFGAAVGATAGAYAAARTDMGIKDTFTKELGETLNSNSSALFILIRQPEPKVIFEELSKYGGKILRTSLAKDDEDQLQEILANRGINPQNCSQFFN